MTVGQIWLDAVDYVDWKVTKLGRTFDFEYSTTSKISKKSIIIN